jgi:Lrp/AsnC family leucine-responsive transcriptional regulator
MSRPAVAELDDVDLGILRALAADGRLSYTDLAKQTGLSTSAAHQRVRRLEERGVIRGYSAVIDAEAVGLSLTAFVSITPLDRSDPDDLPDRLAGIAAIEACHSVAGDQNYLLKVRVATPLALEALLAQIRAAAHVATRTTVVLSTPYENRPSSLAP